MPPKKILFLSRLFHPHLGGVERHVLELSKVLIKKGFEVTIVTEQHDEKLVLEEENQGIHIIRIPHSELLSKIKLWKWISQHKSLFTQSDVIHVHDVFWWVLPIYPFISSKVYITFHGWEGTFPPKKTAILQRKMYSHMAQGVIQVGDYIEKWYGTQADVVTYGATEKAIDSKSNFKELQKVVFLGRLSKDNDIELVIDSFKLLQKHFPSLKCQFIGDGEYRTMCEEVGEVLGFVEDVSKYIKTADAVFTSSYLSILETQIHKRLVCSFYSNSLKKDYLKFHPNAEYMIIGNDAEQLVKELKKVIEVRSVHTQKVEKAYDWASQQSWKKLTSEYEVLWSEK